ncbi:hypothetical protein KAU08_04365 [bacterium]|nr:hypothetical protein [bacterium]
MSFLRDISTALANRPSISLAALLIAVLIFSPSNITAKGIVPIGGSPVVGVTSQWLSDDYSRPVPPLNSILMDETWQTFFPIGNGIPIATWEETESGATAIRISANIVWDDAPARLMTADEVIESLAARVAERWDARWALRGINGIDDLTGLNAVGPHIIEIVIADGLTKSDLDRAFRSPALRLVDGAISPGDGTGPFTNSQPSRDRRRFTAALTHHSGRAYLDEVSIISYTTAEDSVLDFVRGSLDALLIASNELDMYTGSSRAVPGRIETVGHGLIVLMFNPARVPDLNERLSLARSVDRESIASLILGRGAQIAGDFEGNPEIDRADNSNHDASGSYENIPNPLDKIDLLVCDDPAAISTAGRLRANWESLGVQVEIRDMEMPGPLALSAASDAILLSFRIPEGGEGVLPQCLTLYDRSGWWDIAGLALNSDNRTLLNDVRSCKPDADLSELGNALVDSGLLLPIARFDILFAPGPDIALVPGTIYPGPVFWRAFMGSPDILVDEIPGEQDE